MGNPDHKNKLLAVMLLNGQRVQFQLDTGATVNILPEVTFLEVYGENSLPLLENTKVTLVMYSKVEEKPIGKKLKQSLPADVFECSKSAGNCGCFGLAEATCSRHVVSL